MAQDPTHLVFEQPSGPATGSARLVFGETPAAAPADVGTRLVFTQPAVPSPGLVRLVFGEEAADDTPPLDIPDTTLQGGGRLTGLRLHLTAAVGIQLVSSGRITGLRLRIAATYDINVSRPTVGGAHIRWQDAAPHQHATRSAWQQSTTLPSGAHVCWQDASPLHASLRSRWQGARQLHRAVRTAYEQAQRVSAATTGRFQETLLLYSRVQGAFQEAVRTPSAPVRVRFQETYRDRQRSVRDALQQGVALSVPVSSFMRIAVRLPSVQGGRFQQAWPPRPGRWNPPVIPPAGDPCYDARLPVHLVFSDPHDASLPARLVFVCERKGPGPDPQPEPGVVVPIRRVYMVLNSASLRRVDGNIHLPTFSMTLSLDTGSWTWGFSASLPARALADLQPSAFGDPVELEAIVNGVPYRFLAENLSRERTFGDESLRVSGRGLSATLDAPYAMSRNFTNTSALLAQQIAASVLTTNGVPLGWGIEWGMADWLVPANVWSFQGSHIGALNNIADAVGGYVQPHASAKTLRLASLYPTAPWDWSAATPDFVLPADLMVQESITWRENARYDRAFVSGSGLGGVDGTVTRAGTAGGNAAPAVIDPLITHADAVRQRGLSILAPGGRQAMVGLSLPVLSETGVIVPGKMVRYQDGAVTRTGIARGVQVSVDMPEITQRIEVETYA